MTQRNDGWAAGVTDLDGSPIEDEAQARALVEAAGWKLDGPEYPGASTWLVTITDEDAECVESTGYVERHVEGGILTIEAP